MSEITYSTRLDNLDEADWAALRATLIADDFDNGRSPALLERSFRASAHAVLARDGHRIVGTARALSDGVCNAYIVDLWTHSAYRRRGIARSLLRRLLALMPGQHVALFTDDAPDFYRAVGMTPRGVTFETVVGRWLEPTPTDPQDAP